LDAACNRKLVIALETGALPTFLFYRDGREISFLAGRNTSMDEIITRSKALIA